MKFLITSMNFSPEITGIGKYSGEMADWLVENGHEVKVVCAPPYYPDWQLQKPYSRYSYDVERSNGKTVYRCPLWVPSKPTGTKRVLHLISFAISSLPVILKQIFWKPDFVIVVAPSFLTVPASLLVGKASNAVSTVHIQDFEIDAAFDMGLLKGRLIKKIITGVESWIYKRFDLVTTISEKMRQKTIKKGVSVENSFIFPNWFNLDNFNTDSKPTYFRKLLNIPDEGIVLLYSGNMGEKQGLDVLGQVANILKENENIYFIFCGNGPVKQRLIDDTKRLENVRFCDLQPIERFYDLLLTADIHLLPQKGSITDLVMPSKLCGMLASGRPIIASAFPDTEIAIVVNGCGEIVEPDNAQAFANAAIKLASDGLLRKAMGARARLYCEANLNKNNVLLSYSRKLLKILEKRN